MKNQLKHILLLPFVLFFVCFVNQNALCQSSNQEIGLHFSNVNSFSILYKIQRKEHTFYRLRMLYGGITSYPDNKLISANFGLAFGLEFRKQLTDKFSFIHGLEPRITSIVAFGDTNQFRVRPGIGYVLGFNLKIKPNILIGIETIPSLALEVDDFGSSNRITAIAEFDFSTIAITAVYLFKFKSKSK